MAKIKIMNIKCSTYFVILACLFFILAGTAQKIKAQSPNVLFISVDDLNSWTGGTYRNPQVKTPNIDRLANMGVLFTHAYSNSTACNMSRASLMSGKRPSTLGIYSNKQDWRKLIKEGEGLNHHFRRAGYKTLGVGKIYHSYGNTDYPSGWDEYPETPVNASAGENHLAGFWEPIVRDLKDEDLGDWHAVSFGIEQLKEKHSKPFFLAIGLSKPHLPWAVPKKYYELFSEDELLLPAYLEGDLDDVPEKAKKMAAAPGNDHVFITENGLWKKAIRSYLATIAYTDMNIGRLLDALEKSDYKDNTIIVLWGDHGWHFGEKDHWRKGVLWEEGLRTSMIWVVPGLTPKGGQVKSVTDLLCIYPTLCELVGIEPPDFLEGESIAPLLKNPLKRWEKPIISTYKYNDHSIRSNRWRYTRYSDGTEELYDHAIDGFEHQNLANNPEYKDIIKQLSKSFPKINVPFDESTIVKGNHKKRSF